PKVVPPDCSFDVLSGSWSGSARRLLIVSEVTGCVVNAQASGAPDRKATSPATEITTLFIGPPSSRTDCRLPGRSVIPLASNAERAVWDPSEDGLRVKTDGTWASSGGLPHVDVLGGDPKHSAECHSRISPASHQNLGPTRLARRAISVKDP